MPRLTIRNERRLWLWLVAGIAAAAVGCGGIQTISLRELERTPSVYGGQVVTVAGCYHNGPETTLLQPCAEPKPDEVVWVISRSQMENTAKSVPGYATESAKYERPSAKEEARAQQLSKLPNGVFAEVRLRGEFQSSSGPTYGTSPGYRYQFVVHRVLSVSPTRQSN
jgi:hypothetical protein